MTRYSELCCGSITSCSVPFDIFRDPFHSFNNDVHANNDGCGLVQESLPVYFELSSLEPVLPFVRSLSFIVHKQPS